MWEFTSATWVTITILNKNKATLLTITAYPSRQKSPRAVEKVAGFVAFSEEKSLEGSEYWLNTETYSLTCNTAWDHLWPSGNATTRITLFGVKPRQKGQRNKEKEIRQKKTLEFPSGLLGAEGYRRCRRRLCSAPTEMMGKRLLCQMQWGVTLSPPPKLNLMEVIG